MTEPFLSWLQSTDSSLKPNPAVRAQLAWRRINDKPTSVVFRRMDNTDTTPQTVRLEYNVNAWERTGVASTAGVRALTIFGVRDHPDEAVPDTDLQDGYRFVLRGDEYRVLDVIVTHGEVQASCEAIG